MTLVSITQIVLFFAALVLLVKPLGVYMAQVYQGERTLFTPALEPVERLLYRVFGIDPRAEMNWKLYALALLVFSLVGSLAVYALQRVQGFLPLNPQQFGAVSADSAFNTAMSFVSNTNWQSYGGETTMSYLTQMVALTTQNFVSAATGMAVLVALARGFTRRHADTLGNFWVDLTRSVLYILLPLALILAVILVSQGVVQNLTPYVSAQLLEPARDASGNAVTTQWIATGPAASQIAIKQLGTNGGGFFNANSAHPFENPTPLTNFLELLAIVLIPAALCYTFGELVGDVRQGWALLATMLIVILVLAPLAIWAEQSANPAFAATGIDQTPTALQDGGNMEGKEVRFGIGPSALWGTVTTAASNGAVNAMHDSFMPLGGFVVLLMMQLGEVIFGGAGSGLYGLLAFVILAVFIAGLMVGRTPEYLGKKIEAYQVKLVALLILIMPILVLGLTALAVTDATAVAARLNPGAHGFSEILYAFTSMANNNGSAFAGLSANIPFYNLLGGAAMWVARFWLAVPTLALAGSLARKNRVPPSAGTLPTHTPLFVGWLVAVVLLVGALNFLPALALGPIVEQLMMR